MTDHLKWKTLSTEYLTVRRDTVQLPDGRINEEYYILEYPDCMTNRVHCFLALDAEFGKPGTPERARAIEEAGLTQSELAERVNTTKSYISKLEKGHVNPSAGLFFSIINALGMRVEIVKPL